MAEYFPLLERAVAGLADGTPEARHAIYERARAALLGQLRRMDPPVPEEDIARESTALDEAIGRIEANLQAPASAAEGASAVVAPSASAPESDGQEARPVGTRPPIPRSRIAPPRGVGASRAPGLPSAQAPAVATPPLREGPVPASQPPAARSPQRPVAPLRPMSPAEPFEKPAATAPRPLLSARPLNTAPRIGIEPRTPAPSSEPPSSANQKTESAPAEVAPAPAVVGPEGLVSPRADVPAPPMRTIVSNDDETAVARPARLRTAALFGSIALGALVVGAVAFEAWQLRDRPEQVTAGQAGAGADSAGKVVDRAAGDNPSGATTDTAPDTTAVPPPVAVGSQPTATMSPQASVPGQPGAPSSSEPAVAALQQSSGLAQQSTNPALGVTQRAALLIDAPQETQKVKTFVGSVVWKNQSVSAGQGQPLSQAITADVDIPDAKMTMSMVMKRNLEPQFPASHTIEFRFTPTAGNDLGAIKQINVPEMRLDDSAPTGDPLTGLPVAITDNYFLVGLSRGNAEASNIQMLEKRNWFDVSLLLVSGKVAKITFEKGAPGQRIIDDAVKSWQSGG